MKHIRKFNESKEEYSQEDIEDYYIDDVGLPLEYPSYIQISITPNDKSIERINLDS